MSRHLLLSLLAVMLLPAAGPAQKKSALDKATLETYLRHLFVMDGQIKIQIQDAKPSELPGFMDVVVRASRGDASQELHLYVSNDGSKIVQGNVYDANSNPFKSDLAKLKTDNTPDFGTPGAPVVLVEFSDFECPYCKEEALVLRQNLLSTYPKQMRMYFKNYPLQTLHPWAKAGAIAGRCVYDQKPAVFWEYHDWIFQHQDEITPDNLKSKVMEWAGGKPLDGLQLGRCLDTKAGEAAVDKNIAEGQALNVNETPTLFINGRRMVGKIDWPTLRQIIDNEIEYQKTAKDAGEDCGCEIKLDLPGVPAAQPGLSVKKP
jgi:protein-disulfide isomerase